MIGWHKRASLISHSSSANTSSGWSEVSDTHIPAAHQHTHSHTARIGEMMLDLQVSKAGWSIKVISSTQSDAVWQIILVFRSSTSAVSTHSSHTYKGTYTRIAQMKSMMQLYSNSYSNWIRRLITDVWIRLVLDWVNEVQERPAAASVVTKLRLNGWCTCELLFIHRQKPRSHFVWF